MSDLDIHNPLVLATIAAVSLGAALIAHKYSGALTAWMIVMPALTAFVRMLPYLARAIVTISKVAYRDIRSVLPGRTPELEVADE